MKIYCLLLLFITGMLRLHTQETFPDKEIMKRKHAIYLEISGASGNLAALGYERKLYQLKKTQHSRTVRPGLDTHAIENL